MGFVPVTAARCVNSREDGLGPVFLTRALSRSGGSMLGPGMLGDSDCLGGSE